MSVAASQTAYENTVQAMLRTERGAYSNLNHMPVFRASALFYAVDDERTRTYVSFLNYWREKNANSRVSALVSLRDHEGKLLRRLHFPIERAAYTIRSSDLLEGLRSGPFQGSIEVEVFSDSDLKFAFPAMLVFYETPDGVSYVHSNQRVFNNRDDERRSSPLNPAQSGFDVRFDGGRKSYLWIVNGPVELDRGDLALRFFDAAGKVLERAVPLGPLKPYAAREIDLGTVPGAAAHLGGGIGCVKIDAPLKETFCRFLVGIDDRGGNWRSITHSYFDCEKHADYYADADLPAGIDPCLIPLNMTEGVDCDLVFYPILSPASLKLMLRAYSEAGDIRAEFAVVEAFDARAGNTERIDVRKALREHGVPDSGAFYSLHVRSNEGRIPARVTFGLNYRLGERAGTNISSSALLAASHGEKRRTWLWGASFMRPGARNIVMVSNLSKRHPHGGAAAYRLTFVDDDGPICEHTGTIADGWGDNVEVEAVLRSKGQTARGDIVWYILQSENPNLIANQITVSPQGNIGGDHSF